MKVPLPVEPTDLNKIYWLRTDEGNLMEAAFTGYARQFSISTFILLKIRGYPILMNPEIWDKYVVAEAGPYQEQHIDGFHVGSIYPHPQNVYRNNP